MVEAFTPNRATIGELAGHIREERINRFVQILGKPLDDESRKIFDNIEKKQKDPLTQQILLAEEIRVIPLVDKLRDAGSRIGDQKLSSMLIDIESLLELSKEIGISFKKDRLVTAVARLIERQEAE